jgi:hypothetical protein
LHNFCYRERGFKRKATYCLKDKKEKRLKDMRRKPYAIVTFYILMCSKKYTLRGCLHWGGWVVAQKEKWYRACRMRAVGNGVPSTK